MQQENNTQSKELNNLLLVDLKSLSSQLKPLSSNKYKNNNDLINKILLCTDDNLSKTLDATLSHLLHLVQLKGMATHILTLLPKIIIFVKNLQSKQRTQQLEPNAERPLQQSLQSIFYQVIDIIFLLKAKVKDPNIEIRIIQTAFSLIDFEILNYFQYNLLTRVYSICFDCCAATTVVHNISVSALFSLTETLFQHCQFQDSCHILQDFLEFELKNKKFSWIKGNEIKGLVWDLIIIGIKSYPQRCIAKLREEKVVLDILNFMFTMSMERSFAVELNQNAQKTEQTIKADSKQQGGAQTINFKKGAVPDFIRFYKSFIYFSINLAIKPSQNEDKELVPFRENLHLFSVVSQSDRNYRMYIFLEGICLILAQKHDIAITEDKGIILLDALSKISEQLCFCTEGIHVNWESGDFYLEKMCGDFTKVHNGDFVRLIKNTLIVLRKEFENKDDVIMRKNMAKSDVQVSDKSIRESVTTSSSTNLKKKWQRFIKSIIKTIRYLSSLNIQTDADDQPVRKLVLEFQNWFLICPTNRTRNLILQQLMITSSSVKNSIQAAKVSQCVQIGSNLIYGYYDLLDSTGLTILLKMMAAVKADWDDSRRFEELDEVFTMAQRLYIQQNLVKSSAHFAITVQAFVQCVNGLLADLEQPKETKQKQKQKRNSSVLTRLYKMIDYILEKLNFVIERNPDYVSGEWTFLTAFWMSLCSCKNPVIELKTIQNVGIVVNKLFRIQKMSQQEILSLYIQIVKCKNMLIDKEIIRQLKEITAQLQTEDGVVEAFNILKILVESSETPEIYQLQEMLFKDSLFKVKQNKNLYFIIDNFKLIGKEEKQEFKALILLWSFADHLKVIAEDQGTQKEREEYEKLWRLMLGKICQIAIGSQRVETKNAAIHNVTQILSQNLDNSGLSEQFLTTIMFEYYLKLMELSLGVNYLQQSNIQASQRVQMAKIAIVNSKKTLRKLADRKLKSVNKLLFVAVQDFLAYLSKDNQLTLEYYLEICNFLKFLAEEDIQKLAPMDKAKELYNLIGEKTSTFDKSTIAWRKKFQPVFTELEPYFLTKQN